MLNLSFHRDNEENTEIQHENRIVHTTLIKSDSATYGTSKNENQVHTKAIVVALVAECQNLNSGNLNCQFCVTEQIIPSNKRTKFIILFDG